MLRCVLCELAGCHRAQIQIQTVAVAVAVAVAVGHSTNTSLLLTRCACKARVAKATSSVAKSAVMAVARAAHWNRTGDACKTRFADTKPIHALAVVGALCLAPRLDVCTAIGASEKLVTNAFAKDTDAVV